MSGIGKEVIVHRLSVDPRQKPIQLWVYMIRFDQFWKCFLHHTYRVQFHPMLNHTSLLEDKNRPTQGAVNLSGSMRFIRLYRLDF